MNGAVALFAIVCALLFGLAFLRWWDGRRMKKPAKEAMSKALREEIEKEEKDAERRKKSFEDTLKKFGL